MIRYITHVSVVKAEELRTTFEKRQNTSNERARKMSATFAEIRKLVAAGQVQISEHGYDELAEDAILISDILHGITEATVVEDYPSYAKGAALLVLQFDRRKRPIHVVWGIPKGATAPAVLVTAYRPDPRRWSDTFTERRK